MDTRPYDIIYADPPWPQKKVVRKVRPNQKPELDYHTEPVERCIELCVPFFNKAAPKHNVFMWAIDKFIPDTERLMADLGYKVHARLIWDKTNGIPAARTVRFSHEYLLWFFKRGGSSIRVRKRSANTPLSCAKSQQSIPESRSAPTRCSRTCSRTRTKSNCSAARRGPAGTRGATRYRLKSP